MPDILCNTVHVRLCILFFLSFLRSFSHHVRILEDVYVFSLNLVFRQRKSYLFHVLGSHIGYVFLFCFGGVVFCCVLLCSVYFLPFIPSYHFPFIFAVIVCFLFFLACRCHSLQLLTILIFTCVVMYLWYHMALLCRNDIIYSHVLAWCILPYWVWYNRIVNYWLPLRVDLLRCSLGYLIRVQSRSLT